MTGTLGWIVLGLPLLGALILSLFGAKEPPKAVTRWVGCGSIGLSFVLTAAIFFGMLGDDAEALGERGEGRRRSFRIPGPGRHRR